MSNQQQGGGRHTPGRRQFMVRLPADLYRWLHQTSVLEARTKTALMVDAVTWVREMPQWPQHLRTVRISDDPRRVTSFDLPPEIHAWLRLESSEEHWSANELAARTLEAWRRERERSAEAVKHRQ